MDPQHEYEFYEQPENQAPQGPGRKRRTALSKVVPVRLSPRDLENVKVAAKAEGRSVSAWIRQTISRALEQSARAKAGKIDWASPAVDPGVIPLVAAQPPIVLHPAHVLTAQVIHSAEDVISGFERVFERLEPPLSNSAFEDAFTERVVIDADLVELRARHYENDFAQWVARDIHATQSAIARLLRLAEGSANMDIRTRAEELRARLAGLDARISAVERGVLDKPKPELSTFAEAGLINFYTLVDVARTSLASIDEQLYAAARAVTKDEERQTEGTGHHARSRNKKP